MNARTAEDEQPLFDFLYSDHERVAAFLAQLTGLGTPKEAERAAEKSRGNKQHGSLKLGLIGLGSEGERDWSQSVRDTYDPLWTNSKRLIEIISSRPGAVQPDTLAIGKLVIVSGSLVAMDLSFVPHLMSTESMTEFIARGMANASDDTSKKTRPFNKNSEQAKEAQVIKKYIESLPLGLQFILMREESGFYFNIKREYLSSHEMDLPLKFPLIVSGEWHVAGIVDASPYDQTETLAGMVERAAIHWPQFSKSLVQLIGMTGISFGRALGSYGISPLCIYRAVT